MQHVFIFSCFSETSSCNLLHFREKCKNFCYHKERDLLGHTAFTCRAWKWHLSFIYSLWLPMRKLLLLSVIWVWRHTPAMLTQVTKLKTARSNVSVSSQGHIKSFLWEKFQLRAIKAAKTTHLLKILSVWFTLLIMWHCACHADGNESLWTNKNIIGNNYNYLHKQWGKTYRRSL